MKIPGNQTAPECALKHLKEVNIFKLLKCHLSQALMKWNSAVQNTEVYSVKNPK